MKSKFYIASLTLLLLTAKALAEYHTPTEPSLAFPNDFPEAARTNIVAALRRPDCKFLSGSALNSFTSFKYGGDTLALNLFLENLAKCRGVALGVRFSLESSMEDCDWLVTHMAGKPGD